MKLLGKLEDDAHKEDLIFWLIERQVAGFQGRINKIPDTCYSFWIGGSLQMLNAFDVVDGLLLSSYTISCQQKIGNLHLSFDI